jgi:hypothetical protein
MAEIPFRTTNFNMSRTELRGFTLEMNYGSTAVTVTFETQRPRSDPKEIQNWELLEEIAPLADLLTRLVEQERRKPFGVRP